MNDTNQQTLYKLTENDLNALLAALDQSALVAITDAKGDIIYVNKKFVEVSQYSFYELLGQNHRILKWGDEFRELYADMWKTISEGRMWRGDVKNRAKDGTPYWVDATISPIFDADGKIEKYVAVRLLITEKKLAEKEINNRIEETEKLNRLMVDRELKMVEIKEKMKKMEVELAECKSGHKA
ncbi:MAG: PAS domain S-box protein [Patescibacteria group bacterium]